MKTKSKKLRFDVKRILKNIKNFPWRELNLVQKFRLHRFTKEAIIVASIAIFLITNFIFSLVTFRLDLSKDRAYTLSKSTKNLVSDLKKPVKVTLYKSDNVPARAKPFEREVIDLLREFDRASRNINLEIVTFNPQEDSDTLNKVMAAGIYPLSVSQQDQGEVSLSEIYFGVIVEYDNKTEVVSKNLGVADLEYNLTSGIYRLSSEVLPEIGIMGFEPSPLSNKDPISNVRSILSSFFKLTDVTDKVPQTLKTLIVNDNPSSEFSAEELKLIDSYLQKGKAVVLTDGITVNEQTLEAASGEAKLHDILKKRGIIVDRNLILSAQSELVNMGGSGFNVLIPYSLWIKTDNFSTDTSFFTGVSSLTFPWVSQVKPANIKGFEARAIASTTKQSWEQRTSFALFPQQIPRPNESDFKDFSVIAESVSNDSKLMVIGSSRFLFDQYLSAESSNYSFVVNVLSDYASDGALSGIAKRATQVYSLPILPKSVEEIYKYANILLFPIIFGLYGAYRIIKRSRETQA
jgi:ABC-type uncharacterized transport system involved in gliding motility auxiliary subunit